MHGGGSFLLRDNMETDPLTGVWSQNNHGIDDVTPSLNAQDRYGNRLEPSAVQSDGASYASL